MLTQQARALAEERLALGRVLGDQQRLVHALSDRGDVAREAGEHARCAAYYRESRALRQSRGERFAIARALMEFAGLAGRQRQWERVVRLLGAVQGVGQNLGRSRPVRRMEEYQRTVDGAGAALSEAAFAAAWEVGQAMSLEGASAG